MSTKLVQPQHNNKSRVHYMGARPAGAVGVTVVAMTGETGDRIDSIGYFLNVARSRDTGRTQETYVVFTHANSEHVEYTLFVPR